MEHVDLLAEISCENETALCEFYRQTSKVVYGIASKILRDEQDTEEVTLDVYMYVWNKAGNYDRNRATPLRWLVMITKTAALGRLRCRKKYEPAQYLEEEKVASSAESPEESAELGQDRVLIKKALGRLTPEQRRAIELTYFRGLSHSEIAELLSEPLGSVKSWIRLGMRKLREHIYSQNSHN